MLKLRKPKLGTVIFYVIYFALVIAAVIGIFSLLDPLEDWLTKYQASQPEEKCAEVFAQLFEDPDWAAIYDLSGTEDTLYEGRDAYAAYMEDIVGDSQLTYSETSAGLSGNHKYIVRANGKKVAVFTLTPMPEIEPGITHWQLGDVEIFFKRSQSVTVEKLPEHTVYINGTALRDEHVIRSIETAAESYLPEGVHGYRLQTVRLDDLLVQPEVTVKDSQGNAVEMALNDQGILSPVLPEPEPMTEEEREFALEAAKANAKYAIRAIGSSKLKQYFDPDSETFHNIRKTPVFINGYLSFYFIQRSFEVSQFCRYSDGSFSANVSLELRVQRDEKYTKSYLSSITYFFRRQENGKLQVYQTSNMDVSTRIEEVRLDFVSGKETLESRMVDVQSESLQLPTVTVPEGKSFQGWATQTVDENGNITMTILFAPTENGTVFLSEGTVLEPMALYAVFE